MCGCVHMWTGKLCCWPRVIWWYGATCAHSKNSLLQSDPCGHRLKLRKVKPSRRGCG